MKRYVDILLAFALQLASLSMMAQDGATKVQANDVQSSASQPGTSTETVVPPKPFATIPLLNGPATGVATSLNIASPFYLPPDAASLKPMWEGGSAFGSSYDASLPGLGNFRSATIGVTQRMGRFTLTGALSGYKYHINRNAYNDFGIHARIAYDINEHFSFSVWGNYSRNNVFDSPAAMPYVNFSCFGGSVLYNSGAIFGAELGFRRIFDPALNRWQTVPVLAPTVNLGGCAVGVDVGGLIHSLIEGNRNDRPMPPMPKPAEPKGYGSIPGSGPHMLPARAVKPH